MRMKLTVVAGLMLVAATVATVVVAPAAPAGQPQVRLVDNTVAMDPPPPVVPGDGSLADGQVLTPFDVQNPAMSGSTRRCWPRSRTPLPPRRPKASR